MTLQLGLIITEHCNIACDHCLFGAGSNLDAKEMPLADIQHYINCMADIALRENEQFSVALSGGEPLLCRRLLLDSIRYAKNKGAQQISIVSNGYWGEREQGALSIAVELKEAGLSNLAFSMDDFHQTHIPLASLRNAISACKEMEIAFSIKTTVTRKSRRLAEVLVDLGDLLLNQKVTIEEIPCIPTGRAKEQIPPEDLIYQQGIPRESCGMGMMLVIFPDGNTFPCCCTEWNPRLLLGNARKTDFNVLYDRMKEQPLLMILREKGPHHFADCLGNGGYSLNHARFVSNCDLCQKVLAHPGLEQMLPDVLHEWRVERVNKMLSPR